jgi:AraC family transcriptional regulator
MAMSSQVLASGAGWRVSDVVCTAGPRDRPYEEQHGMMCIAVVTEGTFHYRTTGGSAVMAPGSLMLGNSGACFECGHEHSVGDRCLCFQFTREFFEPIAACVPGNRQSCFAAPRLPLLRELLPIISTAEALRGDRGGGVEFHELTLGLAGAVCQALSPGLRAGRVPNNRDKKRIAAALHRIEAEPAERLALEELALEAGTTQYHFLRVFEQVVGVTPGQYILRTRLRKAAIQLRRSNDSILAIAMACGFTDLSTFNRQFRRWMGATPTAFRATTANRSSRTEQ